MMSRSSKAVEGGCLLSTTSSTMARPRGWCATCCRMRISPRSTPSPWDGLWSIPSSLKYPRTPGSSFHGTRASSSSRRFARRPSDGLWLIGYDAQRCPQEDAMDAVTPKPTSPADLKSHHVRVGEMEWQKTRFAGCEGTTLLFDLDSRLVTARMRFAPAA